MHINRSFKLLGLYLALLMLVGCVSDPSSGLATAYTSCEPDVNEANLYRSDPLNTANSIYRYAQATTGSGTADPLSRENGLRARREALKLLATRVRRWSNFTDVQINDKYRLRLTVTFISPEIIEAVVLNQVLYDGAVGNDFSSQVLSQSEGIKKRNELIFLLTLATNEYQNAQPAGDKAILQFPVAQMMLKTAADLSLTWEHVDPYLEEPVDIIAAPVHGYVSYPVAILKDGICQPVIDPLYTTTLTVHVPNLMINDTVYTVQALNIDYQTLLKLGALDERTDFDTPTDGNDSPYKPLDEPARPVNSVSKGNDEYWKTMSRFVWYHLTRIIFP